MNNSELVVLQGEINRLSSGDAQQLLGNPDLLGVWITAALTAAKGAARGIKGIKKAVSAKKRAKAKAKKSKKKDSTVRTQTASAPVAAYSPAAAPVAPGSMNKKIIIPIVAVAAIGAIILLRK